MDIVLHAGAHCTDEDRLVKCLLRNQDLFMKHGVAAPGPSRYRKLLRDAVEALADNPPSDEARDVLLDQILDTDDVRRLVLSHENFFGLSRFALSGGVLYPRAPHRLAGLARLFPEDRKTVCIGLRNPATFLPALFATSKQDDFLTFLDGTDPEMLRWSDLIERLRAAQPEIAITVWCNEDTPLIWGTIIREMAGLEEGTRITGAFDLLSDIMSDEGMRRFRSYLREHPDMTEPQKRRVIVAFLDKFAIEDAVEEELDMPGWDDDYVDMLTARYEEDVARIDAMPDVRLITP